MKKLILSTIAGAILATGAFAFSDNYSINQNMAEKYKGELSQCFNFLTVAPSSQKYFGYLFTETEGEFSRLSDTAFNEERKKQLLGGGYGVVRGHGEEAQKIYRDLEDIVVAGGLIASALKHGRESILVEDSEINKLKKSGERKGFGVARLGILIGEGKACSSRSFVFDLELLDQFMNVYDSRPEYLYFNGDMESYLGGPIQFSVKGSTEVFAGGIPIWTRDSYMGYSLSKGNSFLKR
jgi:hypothetical protein